MTVSLADAVVVENLQLTKTRSLVVSDLRKIIRHPPSRTGQKGLVPHNGPMAVGNMKPTRKATIHTTIATPSAFHQPML